ncbi:hypothetical protein M3090_01610 [Bacteroides sp. ET71]|uniref:hypothetical protein n=1 Tax=Bacteroides sp. ET71 TaxID=2939421 RepID=UPI0020137B2C|nr:hypothetical protein [Bacteroides sp. ET71]MCL1615107.1 hypothetical protein [Bacteroides sp. ET71]
MSTERTYVFGGDGGNGGSKLDITALLPGMLGGRSVDPNLLALMGNRNGFGGQDGWWSIIWLVVIASIFGWNGNGGFFGGGRGGNGLPAELAGNAGRELLMQAIQGNGNAIQQIASSLNCSTQQLQTALCNVQNTITQVGNQVGLTGTQVINALQAGDNNIISQMSSCCCNVLQAIERQGCATQLQNCQNMNTLTREMNNNARNLQDATQAQTQAILAKLDAAETRVLQDKLDAERQKSATLAAQLNNEHQTQTIMGSVAQQIAPLVAGIQSLQGEVDGIKCKLPNTVSVPYPQLQVYNPEVARAAAFGAAAGGYAGYGCGGYNTGFWG